jgi:hypothetical protein
LTVDLNLCESSFISDLTECAGKDASYAYVSDGTNCEAMKPEDDDTNTVAT